MWITCNSYVIYLWCTCDLLITVTPWFRQIQKFKKIRTWTIINYDWPDRRVVGWHFESYPHGDPCSSSESCSSIFTVEFSCIYHYILHYFPWMQSVKHAFFHASPKACYVTYMKIKRIPLMTPSTHSRKTIYLYSPLCHQKLHLQQHQSYQHL